MTDRQLPASARSAWIAAALIAAAGIVAPLRGGGRAAESAVHAGEAHTEKVAGTPHFYQGDPLGRFPEGGRNYCCPTAVSDSLVYLAAHGFPRLLPAEPAEPAAAQAAMIRKLASPDCMATDPATGTDAGEACAGIRHYVEACGYACATLEYRGWRPLPKGAAGYARGTEPSLDQVRRAVADPRGAAWVNIGWYDRGPADGEWERVGGHWVAVVGFGTDGNGGENRDILLVDNPAVRAGAKEPAKPSAKERGFAGQRPDGAAEGPTREAVAAEVMTAVAVGEGRLVGKYKGLPRDAAGTYRVSGPGVAMSKKHDAAFLDGAVVLVIGDR